MTENTRAMSYSEWIGIDKAPTVQTCPCSVHVFQLAQTEPQYVLASTVWDNIIKIGKMDCRSDIYYETTVMSYRKGHMRLYNPYNPVSQTITKEEADKLNVRVLAKRCTKLKYITAMCTHIYNHTQTSSDIVWDMRGFVRVKRMYAEIMCKNMSQHTRDIKHILLPAITAAFVENFDECFKKCDEVITAGEYASIIRTCAREMQVCIQLLARHCGMWRAVPKDVRKIIHRMVFDGYVMSSI